MFRTHRLVMEDIMSADQRPKNEDYGDYLDIVLKMLLIGKGGELVTEQTSIVLGANDVISFQEGVEGDSFCEVVNSLGKNESPLIKDSIVPYMRDV